MEGIAGTTLGRYEVIKHLASGGMAQVLLARSGGIEGFERHVVIKRIHRERAGDDQAVKMFLDEARLAASLHHTNIVQVHDIGQEGGEYFFAMEYIHGEDLRRLLNEVVNRSEKIPLAHVVAMVSAAASALHYAHEHRGLGIVHRDVSPANIILGYDGTVKVVDFGIAKAAFRTTETHSGALKGKIAYMAPEQCMGQSVDRRSDVFALGIVLYELTTARRLFKGSSDFLTMSQIVAGNIPQPSEHRPDVPAELEQVILKSLALSPDDRYQTAEDLRVALDKCGLRSSTSELADYIRTVFGRRPEPWLTDAEEPEISVNVDFDGEATGVAAAPERILTPPPGSLMARVRRKIAPPGGFPMIPVTPAPVVKERRSTESVTPMAWSTSSSATATKKKWPVAVALLGAVAAIAAVVFVIQSKGESRPIKPAAQPSAPAPVAVPAAEQPAPVDNPSEPADKPTEAVAAPAADSKPGEQVATKPEPTKPPAKSRTRTKKTKKTRAKTDPDKWDPTKLLPD